MIRCVLSWMRNALCEKLSSARFPLGFLHTVSRFFAKDVVDKVTNYGNLKLLGLKTLPISSAETFQLSTLSVSKILIEKKLRNR